jgi:hypothetical protein
VIKTAEPQAELIMAIHTTMERQYDTTSSSKDDEMFTFNDDQTKQADTQSQTTQC